MSDRFSIDGWRHAGFAGFAPLHSLDTSQLPDDSGVYAILRPNEAPVAFTPTSSAGHFKGKDPTVSTSVLIANWVDSTETVYIGKATKLRARLRQYRDFGNGRPVGHWGGRYIFQLADRRGLLAAWAVTEDDPRLVEQQLLTDFIAVHARRPFANLAR